MMTLTPRSPASTAKQSVMSVKTTADSAASHPTSFYTEQVEPLESTDKQVKRSRLSGKHIE